MDNCLCFKLIDYRSKLNYFKWAVGPIMLPANYQIASLNIMAMITKVATCVFKFDTNALPKIPARVNATFHITIWESGLNRFYDET